ncbi:MAG: hypothetical protein IPP97_17485 [Candidatus Obscuribacter sp.]|nr:hypothetical protein [Candidatus Obscuribacter sp.]
MYEKQLLAPKKGAHWVWKAKTLVLLSDRFLKRDWYWHSRRFAMLALMDESRLWNGKVGPNHSSFIQLTLTHAIPSKKIHSLAKQASQHTRKLPALTQFPEAMLLSIDESWKSPTVNPTEANEFFISSTYLKHLCNSMEQIRKQKKKGWKQKSGRLFEHIARYLLSLIPGVRTAGNIMVAGTATDFDVLCSWEGFRVNFLQECTSYFVAECKCYTDPIAFSIIAKFARILDEVRCNFGILFTLTGITGQGKMANAEAEQQFLYLNRGVCILIVTLKDILSVAAGENFFEMLRSKYEAVRVLSAARPHTE